MGFFANIKAQKAMSLQGKGDTEGARKLYEEAIAQGMNEPRMLLAYALLLIRAGEFQKAKDLLVKTQKAPGITGEQKTQLFIDYAVCAFKLGNIDRGIDLLEKQHAHQPTGLLYETLGYLYVEKYDPANAVPEEAAPAEDADENTAESPESPAPAEAADEPAPLTGKDKALAFLKDAIEYDDEDPICLDNIGQFYYRVLEDKATAHDWFMKAIDKKEGQIDTLWFLSRYDLEKGDAAAAAQKLEKALEGRFSPLNFANKAMVEEELHRLKA